MQKFHINITDTLINYFIHCKTQCWLHANRINLEDNSEDVRIGKVLHEIREDKVQEVSFEGIKVDKITKDYIVEVKKSDSDIEAAKWQLIYYLYILDQKGITKKGRLEVFEKKKRDKKSYIIELDDEIKKEMAQVLSQVDDLLLEEKPPEPIYENKCKKCAYYEYCFL